MNIYEIIAKAQALKDEKKIDSVSPSRVGALIEDTLKYINEYQLLSSSPMMHKTYASVSAMQADAAPVSDLTGKAMKKGQLVVIVPADSSDTTAGDVYRYDGPSGNTSAWTFISKIGGIPADAQLSATSTNPVQNAAVTAKLTELESKVEGNWAVDVDALIKSSMNGYITHASAKVYNTIKEVALYNLRNEGGSYKVSIRMVMDNGSSNIYSTTRILPAHDEGYAWETISADIGSGIKVDILMRYTTAGLVGASGESPYHYIRDIKRVDNRYIDYSSNELLLQYSAMIPTDWVKAIYKKVDIESMSITRFRNNESGFYLGLTINGYSSVIKSDVQESGITAFENDYVKIILDASLLVGDYYLTIPINADCISYAPSNQVIDNDLRNDGFSQLPQGSRVNYDYAGASYGQKRAIYTIPLADSDILHIYAEYDYDDALPIVDYQAILTVGSNERVQVTNKGLRGLANGLIYPAIFYGLNYNSVSLDPTKIRNIHGDYAFSLRYKGDASNSAELVISSTSMSVNVNGQSLGSATFASGDSIDSLIVKLNSIQDIECIGICAVDRTCGELLKGERTLALTSTFTKDADGEKYSDAPFFYFPYARDSRTHSLEIVIDYTLDVPKVYTAYDGLTIVTDAVGRENGRNLTLGNSAIPITFKNLHIGYDWEDAELIHHSPSELTSIDKIQLISKHNPRILVWEGHGVDVCLDSAAPLSDDMAASTDRLHRVFRELEAHGYIPVTWQDIISWKISGKPLPKRCYNIMMDDFRVDNFVDYRKRIPFNRYNVKAGLAIIEDYSREDAYEVNGISMTKGECTDICIRGGWYPCSHAKHLRLGSQIVSELPNIFKDCALSCDKIGIYSDIIVYPYGSYQNTLAALSASAFKLGVMIVTAEYICRASSDYYLGRYEIGTRESIEDVLSYIQ